MNRRIRKAILRGDAARAEYYEASHRIRSGEHPLRAIWSMYARRMAMEIDRQFLLPARLTPQV